MNSAVESHNSERDALPAASRYFIAKYIPNLQRNEPKNVGVMLWTPNSVSARFIGETDEGLLDTRRIPSFIGDGFVYKEWVAHWRSLTLSNELEGILGPLDALSIDSDAEILGKLTHRVNKTHWGLVPGGLLIDPVLAGQEAEVLEQLYSELVGEYLPASVERELVSKIVKDLYKALRLKEEKALHRDFEVKSKRNEYSFNVDYAYLSGASISRVWQTLPTMPQASLEDIYAEAVAYKCDVLKHEFNLKPDHLRVLVSMNPDDLKKHKRALGMVGKHAQVLNVQNRDDLLNVFANIPKHGPLFS